MPFVKKLTKIGNNWGIVLSPKLMKMLNLIPAGKCEIEVNDDEITIRAYPEARRKNEKVIEAMVRFVEKYQRDFEKLAK